MVIKMESTNEYLRDVTLEDIDLLFLWANNEEVRKNAFSMSKIEYSVHKDWFLNKLKSNCCSIFIMMCNGYPVGQIRLEYDDLNAFISYSIQKEYRRRGYGTKILILAEQKVKDLQSNIILVAQVKRKNIPSCKCFEKLGYIRKDCDNYIEYHKNIFESIEKQN